MFDIFTLDANYDPADIIESYETISWTERYYTNGEFELVSYQVLETMTAMPLNTCISLSVTKQVMIVEEHLIETDEHGVDVIKVSGRSLDGLLDTRYARTWQTSPIAGSEPWYLGTAEIQTATAVDFFMDGSYLASHSGYPDGFTDANHPMTMLTVIASPEVVGIGPNVVRYIKRQPLDTLIRELLREIDGAIRSDRTETVDAGKIGMVVYKGSDKSEAEGLTTAITFSVDNGDFKSVKYLRSLKNHKNTVWYDAGLDPPTHLNTGQKSLSLPDTSPSSFGGFARREIYIDTIDFFRNEEFTGDPVVAAVEAAKKELKKYQRTQFITAEISDALRVQYNTAYSLGDTVTFRGKYNIILDMQITEFTWVQDKNGERAFPTLTEVVQT